MRPAWLIAVALSLAAAPALAATHPSRLADQVGADPEANSPDCVAAKADAMAWDERHFSKTMGRLGRIAVWPLAENKARRKGEEKNEARERVMERLRLACFSQPAVNLRPKNIGQRWPGGKGYDRQGSLDIIVGGREITAWVHPTAKVLMVKARGGGPGSYLWRDEAWLSVVAWSLEPAGCGVSEIQPVDQMAREIAYVCPDGTDLRRLVASGSPLVRRGSWPNAEK